MRKLLIGTLALGWALAAQPKGVDFSTLEIGGEERNSWLFCDPAEPRGVRYGGLDEPCEVAVALHGMPFTEKAFRRLDLAQRDDRRIAEIGLEEQRARQRQAYAREDRARELAEQSALLKPAGSFAYQESETGILRAAAGRLAEQLRIRKVLDARIAAEYWGTEPQPIPAPEQQAQGLEERGAPRLRE